MMDLTCEKIQAAVNFYNNIHEMGAFSKKFSYLDVMKKKGYICAPFYSINAKVAPTLFSISVDMSVCYFSAISPFKGSGALFSAPSQNLFHALTDVVSMFDIWAISNGDTPVVLHVKQPDLGWLFVSDKCSLNINKKIIDMYDLHSDEVKSNDKINIDESLIYDVIKSQKEYAIEAALSKYS